MKRAPIIASQIAIALAFLGCPTTPTPIANRSAVPSDRVFAPGLLTRDAQRSCQLTITRDQGLVGAGLSLAAYLDGRLVARLGAGDTITIYATAGHHYVGAKYPHALVSGATEGDVFLSPDHPVSVRLTIDQNGNLDIKPQSELL